MSDASVVVKLQDQFSTKAKSMADASTAFNKSLEAAQAQAQAYSQRLSGIIKQQSELQTALTAANNELKNAKKSFTENADAANSDKLRAAYEKYNTLKNELKDANDAAKQTRTSLKDLNEETRKSDNGGLGKSLSKAGYAKLVGGAISNLTGTLISSATTHDTGSLINSMLSGAASGAAIGTLAGNTVAGVVIGGVSGLVNGATEVFKSKDEAFKSYVGDLYTQLTDAMTQTLQAGTEIAGSRETIKLSYNTLLGEASDGILKQIKSFADLTPYSYSALSDMGRSLASYGYETEDGMIYAMKAISSAASAVGLSNDQISTVTDVIGRMNSGELSAMQLRRLTYAGLNPYNMLSKQYNAENGGNVDSTEIRKMISDGKIDAQWAAKSLLDYYTKNFGGALETFSQTFEGLTSTMGDWEDNMSNAMGASYNETRKKGLKEQLAWYQGTGGTALSEAYGAIGEAQGYSENYKEQLNQSALSWALTGENNGVITDQNAMKQLGNLWNQYKSAQAQYKSGDEKQRAEAGVKMDSIVKNAEGVASSLYDASEFAKVQAEAEIDLTTALQTLTATIEAWKPGYEVNEAGTKGMASAFAGKSGTNYTGGGMGGGIGISYSHAYGLSRVPYNNYPALLHEGERVQTASEARADKNASVLITGNNFTVREDADIDKIAKALAEQIAAASALS